MKTYYEVHVKYEKLNTETGKYKKTTEQYLVNAVSFGDAELKITVMMNKQLPDQFEIKTDKIVNYIDVINLPDAIDYYKIKIFHIDINDKGKEKRIPEYVLIRAFDIKDAFLYAFDHVECSGILSVNETKIVDVFE